jgi:hypothetical protein
MSAQSDPHRPRSAVAETKYYYRRGLSARELLPAVAAGIGAGLVVFYLTKLLFERTPLRLYSSATESPRLTLHRSSASGIARKSGRR